MRYKLIVSYDGDNYSGFQKQTNKKTIQSTIEEVLSQVLKTNTEIVGSGRTDAGVSAFEQVCHFDSEVAIDEKRTRGHINALLPSDIRVINIEMAEDNFHARFDAKTKTYEYYFYISREVNPAYEKFANLIGYNINVEKMINSCKYFEGTHDFSAFCASNTNVVDKVRTVYDINITGINEQLFKLSITGSGFLYNMVRIIMGTLVEVGMGKINSEEVPQIIESRDRKKAGRTIEPKGLYLKKVIY